MMADADICSKSRECKKRWIAIGFSIYIQIPNALTFPLLRPDIGSTLTFLVTRLRKSTFDKCHLYLYYGEN